MNVTSTFRSEKSNISNSRRNTVTLERAVNWQWLNSYYERSLHRNGAHTATKLTKHDARKLFNEDVEINKCWLAKLFSAVTQQIRNDWNVLLYFDCHSAVKQTHLCATEKTTIQLPHLSNGDLSRARVFLLLFVFLFWWLRVKIRNTFNKLWLNMFVWNDYHISHATYWWRWQLFHHPGTLAVNVLKKKKS